MNNRSNRKGELLVWPGVGPIGSDPGAIREFEECMRSEFDVRVEFVEDVTRRDGTVDTVIRFDSEGKDGSEILFRMFCVHSNIYPISMISRSEYDYDSVRKIQNFH
ncbi:hypothetical protein EBR43_02795 [bacterium]|nr:hypothetical protein [bacterium]